MPAEPLLVMTTCADAAEARELATALVAQRLAACVNSLPHVSSTYRWEGKIERSEECLVLIKTTRDRLAELELEIKARSRYELPEVLAVRVDGGSTEYLRWVEASVAA
jgi:periplasmic divalent cation tolerance protein